VGVSRKEKRNRPTPAAGFAIYSPECLPLQRTAKEKAIKSKLWFIASVNELPVKTKFEKILWLAMEGVNIC
jgi:hypothetical protein